MSNQQLHDRVEAIENNVSGIAESVNKILDAVAPVQPQLPIVGAQPAADIIARLDRIESMLITLVNEIVEVDPAEPVVSPSVEA